MSRLAQDQIITENQGAWICDVDLTDLDIQEYQQGTNSQSILDYES